MNSKSPLNYVGWQAGITYQTKDKEGLNKTYLKNLLTEMKDNGMNFISFMMISHGLNDPIHDGYTWPVKNPKLKCYLDQNCINASQETEFLSDIIEQADGYGFHINLFTNQFWWNPEKVRLGYPDIQNLPGNQNYHHCSDNRDTWRLSCDEVQDLLSYYSSPVIKSYGFEMIGQGECSCPDTMKMFGDALKRIGLRWDGKLEGKQELFRLWQGMRQKQVMEEFVIFIKKLRSSIEIWHHGYMELGEYGGYRFSSDSYKKMGIDVAMPCIHKCTGEDILKKVLKSSENFPLVLHVDTRDTPTQNYPIPLKTPKDILNMGEWVEKNNRKNLIGVVFFNEVATSKENKQAVYEVLRKWRKNGLLQ